MEKAIPIMHQITTLSSRKEPYFLFLNAPKPMNVFCTESSEATLQFNSDFAR